MDNPTPAIPERKDFLLRVVEQFRVLAAEITERHPHLQAEAYAATDEAMLNISGQGEDGHFARIIARFDDRSDTAHKLVLQWEDAAGNVSKLIGLSFTETPLDAVSGLDGRADERDEDSVYATGKVVQMLRDDLRRAFSGQGRQAVQLPAIPAAQASPRPLPDEVSRAPPESTQPLAKVPSPQPDIGHLQAALGELATAAGVKAETVFKPFILAAASGAALKQGDIANYALGALIELALVNSAFLSRNGTSISDFGIEGGPLRNHAAKAGAALFQKDEIVVRQNIHKLVSGMRFFYAEALEHAGVAEAEAKEFRRAAFGSEGAIVNKVIAILTETPSGQGAPRTPLLRRLLEGRLG
jgi:hypothetical protein